MALTVETNPGSWRDLWRLTNRARPFDPRAVRVACTVLALAYCGIAVARHDPAHPHLVWARVAVFVYASVGVLSARQLGWGGLRAYTAGLGILLPLSSTIVATTFGNQLSDMALTALATFVPLAFAVTVVDVALVALAALGLHAGALAWYPSAAVPLPTAGVLLYGATAAGAITGLVMITTRAGLQQSSARWQRLSERERVLREFAQVTGSSLTDEALFDRLAAQVLAAFGPGRCSIVVAEAADAYRVVGVAGFDPARAAALKAAPLGDALVPIARQVVVQGRPVVRPALSDDDLRQMGARWGSEIPARCLVSLPIAVNDGTAGLLVLAGPEPCDVSEDALQLWQAMANQVGVALANRRLLGRLERALRVKSEFLNTMSHELRSPLHVVIGYADMLLETEDTAAVRDPVGRMRASALELLRLVEESMTAARLEGGRLRIRTEEFSAPDLVAELAENVRALPEAKRAAPVEWRIDADVPRVWLDRLKVKEIVQNLVSNAIKFSPAGGVRVHVGHASDALTITVEDQGPGIPPEAQARIFDMFERVEPAEGTRAPGVGLGLYIVQQLVQLMGGTIELESWPDRGSRFTVRLPLAFERAA